MAVDIKDFTISQYEFERLDPKIVRLIKRLIRRYPDKEIRVCRSDTFGYFLIQKNNSDGWIVRWTERQMELAQTGDMLSILEMENPVYEYEKTVSEHRTHGGETIKPRLYLDRYLEECDFNPKTRVKVKINKMQGTIIIQKVGDG